MKRIVVITCFSAVIIGLASVVVLKLQTSQEAEVPDIPPTLEEVIEARFPTLDEASVDAARTSGLKTYDACSGLTLSELMTPGSEEMSRKRRETFFLNPIKKYFLQHPNETLQKGVESWLTYRVDHRDSHGIKALSELDKAITNFSDADTHPLIRLVRCDRALCAGGFQQLADCSTNLFRDLKDAGVPTVLQVLAAQFEVSANEVGDERREREDQLNNAILSLLRQNSETADVQGLVWELAAHSMTELSSAGSSRLVSLVVRDSAIPDFFAHLFIAEHYRNEAWRERGGGYASTVSADGWTSFEQYMHVAARHFIFAWALRRDLPHAAQRMIMVATAHGDQWSTRDWFNLSVTAQFDLESAYTAYRHTLKPRWGGSRSKMLEFGYECAATKDYSSGVGNFLYSILCEIRNDLSDSPFAEPMSPAEFAAFFDDETLHAELRQHWTNVDMAIEAGQLSEQGVQSAYAHRAMCALVMKDLKVLQLCLDKLNDGPQLDGNFALCNDGAIRRAYAHAVLSEHSDTVVKIDERYGADFQGDTNLNELNELHRQLDQLESSLPSNAIPWLTSIRRRTAPLISFYSDQWVELPFSDLTAWHVFGHATVERASTVVVRQVDSKGRFQSPRVEIITPFPPPYKVIATFEPIETDTRQIQAVGIDLGTALFPTETGGCFVSAMTQPRGGGIKSRYPPIEESFEFQGADSVTTIRVNAWHDFYEAQYDEYSLPIPSHAGFRASNRLAFGGCRSLDDYGSVRISDVRIRRLPKRPDPVTATIDDVANFHELVTAGDPEDRIQTIKLADARVLQNRFSDALGLLKGLRDENGDSFMTWPTHIEISLATGAFAEAATQLDQMIQINPVDLRLRQQRAWLLATAPDDTQRNGNQALQQAQQLVAEDPGNWRSHLTLSAAMAEVGDTVGSDAAFEQCEQMIAADLAASEVLKQIREWRDEDGKIRLHVIPDKSSSK